MCAISSLTSTFAISSPDEFLSTMHTSPRKALSDIVFVFVYLQNFELQQAAVYSRVDVRWSSQSTSLVNFDLFVAFFTQCEK